MIQMAKKETQNSDEKIAELRIIHFLLGIISEGVQLKEIEHILQDREEVLLSF